MDESKLLKFALIGSLVGLISLFFISNLIKPEQATIDNLQSFKEQDDVYLQGVVSQINYLDKIILIDIVQPKSTTVMLFDESNLQLEKGDFVEVRGEVREYKGEKELVADSIEVYE